VTAGRAGPGLGEPGGLPARGGPGVGRTGTFRGGVAIRRQLPGGGVVGADRNGPRPSWSGPDVGDARQPARLAGGDARPHGGASSAGNPIRLPRADAPEPARGGRPGRRARRGAQPVQGVPWTLRHRCLPRYRKGAPRWARGLKRLRRVGDRGCGRDEAPQPPGRRTPIVQETGRGARGHRQGGAPGPPGAADPRHVGVPCASTSLDVPTSCTARLYTSIGCAPCTRAGGAPARTDSGRPLVVGSSRNEVKELRPPLDGDRAGSGTGRLGPEPAPWSRRYFFPVGARTWRAGPCARPRRRARWRPRRRRGS